MRKRIFVYFKRTARSDSREKNNRKRPGKDSKKPPTTFKVGLFAGQLQLAHRKRFSAVPILGEALHGLKGVDIYERFHLTHIPTVFCLSFECGWWERGKAERVLPAFVRARPCKKGPFFFYSPDHREEDHYLYLLSVIAVFCCLASFFYFKIFG